jgi:hypothetical protein
LIVTTKSKFQANSEAPGESHPTRAPLRFCDARLSYNETVTAKSKDHRIIAQVARANATKLERRPAFHFSMDSPANEYISNSIIHSAGSLHYFGYHDKSLATPVWKEISSKTHSPDISHPLPHK